MEKLEEKRDSERDLPVGSLPNQANTKNPTAVLVGVTGSAKNKRYPS